MGLTFALLLALLLVVVFVRTRLLLITVVSGSMSPAFEPGDRALVLRCRPRSLARGQVVVVWLGEGTPNLKRVVGLPGDTLVTSIDEVHERLRHDLLPFHDAHGCRRWLVPAGHCFVRGDHPPGGFDSLSWGPIPLEKIMGVVVTKLLPGGAPKGER